MSDLTTTTTGRLLPLEEVCAEWGLFEDMADPVRWLRNQILSGRITARKIGHHWRMSRADIDAALAVFANTSPKNSKVAVNRNTDDATVATLSAAAQRRRMAVIGR